LARGARGHIVKRGAVAIAEPTARDKPDRLAGDPAQTSRGDTVVAKAIDDKPPAVRRCNKFNDMGGGRHVVPITMPLIAWLVCKGWLTKQQSKANH
jgi:hypothetical protein